MDINVVYQQLSAVFGLSSFSLSQVVELFGVTGRTARTWLHRLDHRGEVQTLEVGGGRHRPSIYRLRAMAEVIDAPGSPPQLYCDSQSQEVAS